MIQIILNGKTREIPAQTSVKGLLSSLKIDPTRGGIAVALNASVVPRSKWPQTIIEVGDEVEIVRATAGG